MRQARFALLLPLLWTSAVLADAHAPAPAGPTPDQAYQQILEGHARFITNARTLPRQDEKRRCETTTGGQHPVAAILSCADSRVPPEILFDQGIGDLFVIRVAGNVAAADELGTLEYGVEHLNIPLIVVMGHTKCGAVTAVVDGAHAEGNLAELLQPIVPAAARARQLNPTYKGPQLVGSAIQENVRQSINDLSARSPVLAKAISSGKVKVVGGVYDIHAGQVNWLPSTSLALADDAPTEADAHAAPATPAHAESAHGEPARPATPAAHAAADHDEPDAHAAPKAAKPAPAKSSHAVVDLTGDSDDHVVTPPRKPAKALAKPAAVQHADADDDDDAHAAKPAKQAGHGKPAEDTHGPHATAHDEADDHDAAKDDEHAPAKTAKAGKTEKTETAAAGNSLLDNWPVLTGVAVASTLIGAAITRFAPKHAA